MPRVAAILAACVALAAAPGAPVAAGDAAALEALRLRGDLAGQRRHLWMVLDRVVGQDGAAALLDWYGAAETFAPDNAAATDRSPRTRVTAFRQTDEAVGLAAASMLPPLIVRTHYNTAAYRHIRAHDLHRAAMLAALRDAGPGGPPPSVPGFPRDAIVAKSAWWPVPRDAVVPLPVWDPADNAPRPGGNDYPSWRRAVAVCGHDVPPASVTSMTLPFLGRDLAVRGCAGVERFAHIELDAALATALGRDPSARRLAALAMGRPLRAGDALVLVALHVATRELDDWVWGTFWWHDRPDPDAAAGERPARLVAPWSHYRMSVAFDAARPLAADGGPLIAYNPWFEARFPDTGQGGGVASNCLACHRRAAFPARDPFVVTRGDRAAVIAGGDGARSLANSALGSIPLEAR